MLRPSLRWACRGISGQKSIHRPLIARTFRIPGATTPSHSFSLPAAYSGLTNQTIRSSSSAPHPTTSRSTMPDIATELVHPIQPPAKPSAPPTILDRILPKWAVKAKPYLLLTRIDKPIGSILLFWPCGTDLPLHVISVLTFALDYSLVNNDGSEC
jgi:hypothetical protein